MKVNVCNYSQEMEDLIENYKKKCISQFDTSKSKKDQISYFVYIYLIGMLNEVDPKPSILKRYLKGEQIATSTVLYALEEFGISLGALLYRIAERLENEIQGNGIVATQSVVRFYVNGTPRDDIPSDDYEVSDIYYDFFRQSPNAVNSQIKYYIDLIHESKCKLKKKILQDIFKVLEKSDFQIKNIEIYECIKDIFTDCCVNNNLKSA